MNKKEFISWRCLDLRKYVPIGAKAITLLVDMDEMAMGSVVCIKGKPNTPSYQLIYLMKMYPKKALAPSVCIVPIDETLCIHWSVNVNLVKGFPTFCLSGYFI